MEESKKTFRILSSGMARAFAIAIGISTIIGGIAGYYAIENHKETVLQKEIKNATATIDDGIKCRNRLVDKAVAGDSVSQEELKHAFSLIDEGLRKLDKISNEPEGQEAIQALLNFYIDRNQEHPNEKKYDQIINKLETMLAESQAKYGTK